MPVYELILSSDTINEGRIKINDAFSATTGLWSGGTGLQSVILNNSSGNIASGDYSFAAGYGVSATTIYAHVEGYNNIASGNSSHAEGRNTTASGDYSHAEGNLCTAAGIYSHAEGYLCTASNSGSHAEGGSTTSAGIFSHAEGTNNIALGNYSHAQGSRTIAGGLCSFTGGLSIGDGFVNASGRCSFAFYEQTNTTLTGGANSSNSAVLGGKNHYIIDGGLGGVSERSIIIGGGNNSISSPIYSTTDTAIIAGDSNTITNGSTGSVIIGGASNTITEGAYSVILGGFNNNINYISSVIVGDNNTSQHSNCFIFGSRAMSRSAHTMTFGYNTTGGADVNNNTVAINAQYGNIVYEGSLVPGTADYAEYFEWLDGNLNNEDRYGYFVSLKGDKIEVGNYRTIGIVSVNPSIAGDGAPLKWRETYLTDEWDKYIYKEYDMYELEINSKEKIKIFVDSENNRYLEIPCVTNILGTLYDDSIENAVFIKKVKEKILNPKFNPNETYIPREERIEWSAIGLLGKLRVRTAEKITGSTISSNSDGMAINGSDYNVLETIKEYDGNYGIVKVLFR